MTRGRVIALGLVGALVLTGLAFAGYLAVAAYSLDAPCSRQVLDEKVSPDGQVKARLVESDCGATTPYSTRVLVTRVAETFDEVKDEAATFKGHARRLEWADRELRVFYADAEPLKRPERFRDVRISYWRAD